jgi:nicotinate-nucleotide adenylyltransferase
MKIGIFGGSFNPIHNGHIALAQAVLKQCRLDEVWLMVSPQNPLKRDNSDLLDDRLRFEMAVRALEGMKGVRACDYEFHLPKPSYTWNTLQHLTHDYPDATFILLIGGDNWAHFQRWYHWEDIQRMCDIAVYPREGFAGTFDAPLVNVSSTEIREKVKQGQSIQGLVPDSIISLVEQYYK